MVLRNEQYINFRFTTDNINDIDKAKLLFSKLNLGNRLMHRKEAFILNLLLNLKTTYDNQDYLVISLNKNMYTRLKKNQKVNYQSHDIVNMVLTELIEKKYLRWRDEIRHRKIDGNFALFSRGYYPTENLHPYLENINTLEIRLLKPDSFIVLKKIEDYDDPENITDKEVEVEFKQTRLTKQLESDLQKYNDLRDNSELSIRKLPEKVFLDNKQKSEENKNGLVSISAENLNSLMPENGKYGFKLRKSYLSRIFNRTFKRGGRFYRGVESGMPTELRKYIHINGKPTVELDYTATHYMMLYNLSGAQLRKDPYIVEKNLSKNMRSVYKSLGLICLNAKNLESAKKALCRHLSQAKNRELLEDNTKEKRMTLIKNFARYNKTVQSQFFKQKCHLLTNYDSKIAHDVLMHFTHKGILVLCIHDSFIIQKRYEKELLKMMKKFYKDRFGFNPKVGKK